MADADQSNLTILTVDLLSAYLANNSVQHGDLGELIKSTHAALKTVDAPEPPAPVEPEHKPAVGIRKSLGSPNHIISMIDGKPYQTLRRHLTKHGLTDKEYRERYSLPLDYPMVAPAYSESRRAIAARLGLGRKVKDAQTAAPEQETVEKQPAASKPRTSTVKTSTTPAKVKNTATPKEKVEPKSNAKVAKPALKGEASAATKPNEPAKPTPKPRTARKSAPAAAPSVEAASVATKPAPKKRAPKVPSQPKPAS